METQLKRKELHSDRLARLHHFELSHVMISFIQKTAAGLLLEPQDLDKEKFLR